MSDATDRLQRSRECLRLAMVPPPTPVRGSVRLDRPSWLNRIGTIPLVTTVTQSVEQWWSHHPLRPVAQVAGDASSAVVKPIAQSNPLGLVAGAAVVGAAFAWSRPWRWIFRSALFAGLVPQLVSRVVSTLPIETWISMASSAISAKRSPVVKRREGASGRQ